MTMLYDLLMQSKVVGGGVILGVDDMFQRAMPIAKVERIFDNWLVLRCPWEAMRETPDESWQFWQDGNIHAIAGDLDIFARQTVSSEFKILVEDVSDTGFTWRPRSTREPEVNASFTTIYYNGHFPISPSDVVGMPADLANPSSWGAPTLSLSPGMWMGLIGYNDAQSRKVYNNPSFDPDDVLHLLPRCCGNISALRETLSSIFDRGGVMTPFDLESLRTSIEIVFESHDFVSAESQIAFDYIKAQLEQMPTYV